LSIKKWPFGQESSLKNLLRFFFHLGSKLSDFRCSYCLWLKFFDMLSGLPPLVNKMTSGLSTEKVDNYFVNL